MSKTVSTKRHAGNTKLLKLIRKVWNGKTYTKAVAIYNEKLATNGVHAAEMATLTYVSQWILPQFRVAAFAEEIAACECDAETLRTVLGQEWDSIRAEQKAVAK